jgi:hypothetical protein
LGFIFSGFTLFSLLRRLFNWLLGRPNVEITTGSDLAKEFQPKKTSWSTIFALIGMTAISAPILFAILSKIVQAFARDDDEEEEEEEGL